MNSIAGLPELNELPGPPCERILKLFFVDACTLLLAKSFLQQRFDAVFRAGYPRVKKERVGVCAVRVRPCGIKNAYLPERLRHHWVRLSQATPHRPEDLVKETLHLLAFVCPHVVDPYADRVTRSTPACYDGGTRRCRSHCWGIGATREKSDDGGQQEYAGGSQHDLSFHKIEGMERGSVGEHAVVLDGQAHELGWACKLGGLSGKVLLCNSACFAGAAGKVEPALLGGDPVI